MVECGICLEEYQEGDLELHWQTCMVRLMFRCSLCDEDYASKEGLWNHLALHEIADESKELHYQEIKAKHKLHQCVLCNDQRAYSESPYWKHVHDVHDGFFLRCSDCGESFRSEQLKNDHALSDCKTRNKTVPSDSNALKKLSSDVEHIARGRQSSNTIEVPDNRLSIDYADNDIIGKKPELPTINLAKDKDSPSPFACDFCGITFSSNPLLLRHKRSKFSCIEGRRQKCPHCWRKFQIKEYQAHVSLCEKKRFSCKLCHLKFRASVYLRSHMKNVHHQNEVLENEKPDENQVKNHTEETTNLAGKTTRRSGPETSVSRSDSSSSSNVVEDTDISMTKKDVVDKSVQLDGENPSSRSSGTKCVHCDKECVNASNLRRHFLQSHQPTKCDICGIIVQGYSRLQYHKLVKHTKPKYECAKCSMQYHYVKHYERHLNVCDPVQSDLSSHKNSDEPILKERSDPKVATEKSSFTKCSHCGINESSADDLARHIFIHHDPVACDLCGITFSSLSQAQLHMKTMHKESKHKCSHCSMRFSWKVTLQRHTSHCEYETVPCDFCGKMFRNVLAVNKHKRRNVCRTYEISMEQEQKNAKTSLCDENDSTSVMGKNSRPFVEGDSFKNRCHCCNEEFSSPGYLSHHLKVCHELTKCDICEITILGISAIKNHKKKCHFEPKHECPTCGRKFQNKTKFKAHCFVCERKRYLCKLCEHTFKQLNSIKRHCKTFHPEESIMNNIEIVQYQKKETTTSARDDQEQSTVDPSSKVDVSDSQSNEHSLADLNDDDCMDGKVIDKPSGMVSHVENLSNHPYSCNICGITLSSYAQINYHMKTRHMEGKHKCPHCSRKFHHKKLHERHALVCASLKHSCDLCGQKFNLLSKVENHKKRVHQGSRPLRNASVEGVDGTEEPMQQSVQKIDAGLEMASCINCRISFASTDELMKHKVTCSEPVKKHDDSQFGAEKISLLHGVKGPPIDSRIVPQGENIELKLEIKVEETMLQEQEYLVTNEDPARWSATSLHLHGATLNDDAAEDADDPENGIKVKEEYLEDEEEILTEHQSTTESSECHGLPINRNESLVSQDQFGPCSICGLAFESKTKMRYHMTICHSESQHKCSRCQKTFHLIYILRRHEKSCTDPICNKCGRKFVTRRQLNYHNKLPRCGKSKDV